ncbi:hypothetical protein HGRIS_011421 [Hohenbuehelia grisea]|uniref:Uncharacterized protein n=1 Tax=Hohenbuehelia grisea TaxID=104357 RepID=A0ABR3JWE1_9AGAR
MIFDGQGANFSLGEVLHPPVGCYVKEQDDLGGWGRSIEAEDVVSYRDSGCLSRHLEKFDPSDDCDLEP